MVDKIKDYGLVVASGVLVLAAVYFLYATALDGHMIRPVLDFGTRASIQTHRTMHDKYRPGDLVHAELLMHKNRNIEGIIRWNLIDGTVIRYPARVGSLPVGVWDKIVPVEVLPKDLQPGTYWFCGTVTYHVLWPGVVTYPIWTNQFEVVK